MFHDVDLAEIARLWMASTVPALLAWPLLRRAFPRAADGGWAFARIVGLAGWTLAAWLPTALGLTAWSTSIVLLGGGAMLVCAAASSVRRTDRAAVPWRAIAEAEGIFLLALLAFLALAPLNGDLNPRTERFMDYALLKRMSITDAMPPIDPWLAGERVHYYYYGYVLLDVLRRLSGIPIERFFNLALVWIFASLAVTAFGAGRAVTGRRRGGFVALVLVTFAGNLAAWGDVFAGRSWTAIDWFGAGRVLDGAITEFPFFAWLWGDPHPYVIAMPIVLTSIGLAACRWRHARGNAPGDSPVLLSTGLLAVVAGSLVAVNAWDFPVVALAVAGLLAAAHRRVLPPALFLVLALAAYAPFTVDFLRGGFADPAVAGRPPGLAWSPQRSSVTEMLTMWAGLLGLAALGAGRALHATRDRGSWIAVAAGGAAVVGLAFLWSLGLPPTSDDARHALGWMIPVVAAIPMVAVLANRRTSRSSRLGAAMTTLALAAVLGVEWIHVDDHYTGGLERMNTVFKVYVQAWLWMALGAAALVTAPARASIPQRRVSSIAFLATATALVIVCLGFTAMGTASRYGDFDRSVTGRKPTLDALAVFRDTAPDAAEIAAWIERHTKPDDVILESTARAYDWAGRIATVTGRPTVVGWQNHEAGWRGSWAPVLARARDVERFYRTHDLDEAERIARRYRVRFAFVGAIERRQCDARALAKFERWECVAQAGAARLYRLPAWTDAVRNVASYRGVAAPPRAQGSRR